MCVVSERQLRKAAIKVVNNMIHAVFTLGPHKKSYDPFDNVNSITQKCLSMRTCKCLPHLCFFSYCKFQRAACKRAIAILDNFDTPTTFFTDKTSLHCKVHNPLLSALLTLGHSEDYIDATLDDIHLTATVNETATQVTFTSLDNKENVSYPICLEECECCSIIIR